MSWAMNVNKADNVQTVHLCVMYTNLCLTYVHQHKEELDLSDKESIA